LRADDGTTVPFAPAVLVIDRLREPGWFQDALAAIGAIDRGACRRFTTPVTLQQFASRDPTKGAFVGRILGGEFEFEDRPANTRAQKRTGTF